MSSGKRCFAVLCTVVYSTVDFGLRFDRSKPAKEALARSLRGEGEEKRGGEGDCNKTFRCSSPSSLPLGSDLPRDYIREAKLVERKKERQNLRECVLCFVCVASPPMCHRIYMSKHVGDRR